MEFDDEQARRVTGFSEETAAIVDAIVLVEQCILLATLSNRSKEIGTLASFRLSRVRARLVTALDCATVMPMRTWRV